MADETQAAEEQPGQQGHDRPAIVATESQHSEEDDGEPEPPQPDLPVFRVKQDRADDRGFKASAQPSPISPPARSSQPTPVTKTTRIAAPDIRRSGRSSACAKAVGASVDWKMLTPNRSIAAVKWSIRQRTMASSTLAPTASSRNRSCPWSCGRQSTRPHLGNDKIARLDPRRSVSPVADEDWSQSVSKRLGAMVGEIISESWARSSEAALERLKRFTARL